MNRSERGMVRSDVIQMSMCMLSGVGETKSRKIVVRRLHLRSEF